MVIGTSWTAQGRWIWKFLGDLDMEGKRGEVRTRNGLGDLYSYHDALKRKAPNCTGSIGVRPFVSLDVHLQGFLKAHLNG